VAAYANMTAAGRCTAALARMLRELDRPAGFASGAAAWQARVGMRGFTHAITGAAANTRSGLRSRPLAFSVRSDACSAPSLLVTRGCSC